MQEVFFLNEKSPRILISHFFSSGIEPLRVFACALEDVSEYCGFCDFLDTFMFRKMTKENIDAPELRIPRGELKARIFIRREDKKSSNGINYVG